ncbi:MAG: LEPR-XLL domain-containing protein, partial [Lentisphaeria bacterium]|nr:LEPR-XLL domain-containing protein [Lentisphaeria bacterium]
MILWTGDSLPTSPPDQFQCEALEPRVLLSADPLADLALSSADETLRVEHQLEVSASTADVDPGLYEEISQPPTDLFDDLESLVFDEPSASDEAAAETSDVSPANEHEDASTAFLAGPEFDTVATQVVPLPAGPDGADTITDWQIETLLAANPPPAENRTPHTISSYADAAWGNDLFDTNSDGSAGGVTLVPAEPSDSIGIGNGAAGDFVVSQDDLDALAETESITIGGPDGAHVIEIGAEGNGPLSIGSSLTIQNPQEGGEIFFLSDVVGDGSLTIFGSGHTTTFTNQTVVQPGDITINDAIVISGNVTLEAGGNITIDAPGTITGNGDLTPDNLILRAGGSISITGAISGAGLNNLIIETASSVSFVGALDLNGELAITIPAGDIEAASSVQTRTNITMTTAAATSDILLDGTVSTTEGSITLSGRDITLVNAVTADSGIDLSANRVLTLSGTLTSENSTVSLTSADTVALAAAITTSGGKVTVTGDEITGTTAASITTTGGTANPGGAAGEVLVHSTGTGIIALQAAITANGGAAQSGDNNGGAGGVVTVLNTDGSVEIADITTRGGTAAGTGSAGADGIVQLKASGTITQRAGSAIDAGSLKIIAAGNVTLNTAAGNEADLIAAELTAAASLNYASAKAFNVGTVPLAGTGDGQLAAVTPLDGFSLAVVTGSFDLVKQTGVAIDDGNLAAFTADVLSVSLTNAGIFVGIDANVTAPTDPPPTDAVGFNVPSGASLDLVILQDTATANTYTGLQGSVTNAGLVGITDLSATVSGNVQMNKGPAAGRLDWSEVTGAGNELPGVTLTMDESVELALNGSAALNIFGFAVLSGSFDLVKQTGVAIDDSKLAPFTADALTLSLTAGGFVGVGGSLSAANDSLATVVTTDAVGFNVPAGSVLELAILQDTATAS